MSTSSFKGRATSWVMLLLASSCQQRPVIGRSLKTDPTIRANRFPSVEERVKLYMSNWYFPPCDDYDDGFVHYELKGSSGSDIWPSVTIEQIRQHPLLPNNSTTQFMEVDSVISPDLLLLVDQVLIRNCANRTFLDPDEWSVENETDASVLDIYDRVKFRGNMRMYCHDVQDSVLVAVNHIQWENEKLKKTTTVPTLMQFGDNKESHKFGPVMIPHLKKFRSASSSPAALDRVTEKEEGSSHVCLSSPRETLSTVHKTDSRFEPIVWKLATHRHFEKLFEVYRLDTHWDNKKDMAIFRGQLTGSKYGYDKSLSDEENCHRLTRCRLVVEHGNSTLIDAKLTNTRNRLPDSIRNVTLTDGKIGLNRLLEFKGIVMLEGNDVASGLKWALLSQSVVLMPTPKHTSWAMEELLRPWVHYIPIDEFASNVEEQMLWIVENDEKARRISERATLWMEDMVFHPDAAEDDRLIQEEIIRRYQAHFREAGVAHLRK